MGTDGVLTDRRVCAGVSIFCITFAVWNWALLVHEPFIEHPTPNTDWLTAAFVAFFVFLTVRVAVRSAYWADRVVFGALALAFALLIARTAYPSASLAIGVLRATMWTIAASVGLFVLARPRTSKTF